MKGRISAHPDAGAVNKGAETRARTPAAGPTPGALPDALWSQRLGNSALQALLAGNAAATPGGAIPLQVAEHHRRRMGERFGMSFADVRLRTDREAAARAASAGAQAYNDGDEIGFAAGAFAPGTVAGRLTIAHEFAHVAQRRGGNAGAALPAASSVAAAEWQARQAANAVESGEQPHVSAFAGADVLYDSGHGGGAPELNTSGDADLLAKVRQMLADHAAGRQRRDAIVFLAALAIKIGPARAEATQLLFGLLAGLPVQNIDDHRDAIDALLEWTGKNVRAYDLLLYGRFWFADHAKDEIGSDLALGAFRNYLHYAGGKLAIAFFESRINGTDAFRARLAARVVADLLDGENEPDAQKYHANYAALRAMARANGWDSYGPLAVASATPRIFSALAAVRQQARALRHLILTGPDRDPLWEAETARLERFAGGLDLRGSRSVDLPQGGTKLIYSAENREETEHALLKQDATWQAEPTQEMARAYGLAAAAAGRVQQRIAVLHANAAALDQFIGATAAAASDERLALFDLRHDYIETWLSVFDSTFGTDAAGLAAGYQNRLDAVDEKFENFDRVVAERKFASAGKRFDDYRRTWTDGNNAYPGNNGLDEKLFFVMRNALQDELEHLTEQFALERVGQFGGRTMRVDVSADGMHSNLHDMAALDRDTSLFGLQAALFLVYASNLSIHQMMIRADVGSSGFRAEQGGRLVAMRTELEGHWNARTFDVFIGRVDTYQQTFDSVVEKIRDRVKIDFLLGLVITLVAALVTEGAALAVRLASLSEMLALARTARALGSMSTLLEVGVFTTTELSMQRAIFGKEITVSGAAKAAATNLAFMGAMKAVGKFAEPLAQGSRMRRLVIGNLVGFSGVAAVSATLNRIETGRWPPDLAAFLGQTAATYLLIVGMHHAFQAAAKPAVQAAAAARWERLAADNQALADRLRTSVDNGTLTRTEFDALRAERVRIVEEARALHEVMKDAGLITAADMVDINKLCDNALADVKGASFPVGADAGADPVVRALPAPDSVPGIVRVGETDTYVYDPARPREPMARMLERYTEKGYKLQGNDALLQLVAPDGGTRLMLSAAPVANTRLMLPVGSSGAPSPTDPLARATGLADARLAAVRQTLAAIQRDLEARLVAEYPDHTVLATLALLVEQSSTIKPGWPIDGIRGVADALSLERGIPRSAVRRLFVSVDPARLPTLFRDFHDVVASPNVGPGSRFLIADDLLPKNSVILIDAWRQMQKAGLALPDDMDLRAVRGLARQIERLPGGWLQWLSGIAKAQRGARLRAQSGLTDPTVRLPDNVTELLASISADITGFPGLNPLAGADGAAFVKDIESRAPQAKFADPGLRAAYVIKVDSVRRDVAMLQQGRALEHGLWEGIVGRANEVRKTASVLLTGATVLVSDREVGPKGQLPNVDLANFPLPGGGKVVNESGGRDVHMDLLFSDAAGAMTALEMTTGELTLPTECAALDPKNPAYGGDVDWAALTLKKGNASHRKFMQAIKIYQLNKMATALGSAWSGQPVDPSAMRFQAGDFSAAAARALENMGFQLELQDGTRATAAQVEARKKPGAKP